jgi:hypothetical protein
MPRQQTSLATSFLLKSLFSTYVCANPSFSFEPSVGFFIFIFLEQSLWCQQPTN